MARKPPDWRQPSLFPADPATSVGQVPDNTPEPQDNATPQPNGDLYAVQNDSPRTAQGTDGASRTTPQGAQAPVGDGALRQGAENQPRSLETAPLPDATGQRPEPNHERSPGNSPQGVGGSFALRVSGRRSGAVPRRGD